MSSAPATGTKVKRLDPKPLCAAQPQAPEPTAWRQAVPPPSTAAWLVGLLQASDSFFPTGSYAHSFGLEGLVQEGVIRDRETLRQLVVHSALPSLQRIDLPLAAHAWRALQEPDWKAIGELCVLSSALKSAREARLASENIGRQRAELAANLHHSPLAQEFLRRASEGAWPFSAAISAALEARAVGVPLEAMLAGVVYANLAALLAAAMKILRLGQNGAQSLLTEALATTPALVAAAIATPVAEIGWFNPWLDIAAARHETADARMFIS